MTPNLIVRKEPTLEQMKETTKLIRNCKTENALAKLLHIEPHKLALLSLQPKYKSFKVPKKNGKFRLIENPNKDLKALQRKLNYILQCLYFPNATNAAYGFLESPKDHAHPRNLANHARNHLNATTMLNVDLKDFFHQVKSKRIAHFLSTHPYNLVKDVVNIITKLVVLQDRLPMGAPTSPILSNICASELDQTLERFCNKQHITYTRFADDLTFSSNKNNINPDTQKKLFEIIESNNFLMNTTKIKRFGPNDKKVVCNLVVTNDVEIPQDYFIALKKDIARYKKAKEIQLIANYLSRVDWIQKFKKRIEGRINFIGQIYGYDSPTFYNYNQLFKNAKSPKLDPITMNWLNFGYSK